MNPTCLHCQLRFLTTALESEPESAEYCGATAAGLGSLLCATLVGYTVQCRSTDDFGTTWNQAYWAYRDAIARVVEEGVPPWIIRALQPSVEYLLEPNDELRIRFTKLTESDAYRIWTGAYNEND